MSNAADQLASANWADEQSGEQGPFARFAQRGVTRTLAIAFLQALVIVGVAWLNNRLQRPLIHAQVGVGLAVLLIGGRRDWLGVLLGSCGGYVIAMQADWRVVLDPTQVRALAGGADAAGREVLFAAAMACIDTFQALLGALLLTRVHHLGLALDRVYDVVGLFVWGALVSPLLGALVTAVVSIWCGLIAPDAWGGVFVMRWLGGGTAVLLVTGFLLAWQVQAFGWRLPRGRRLIEAVVLVLFVPLLCKLAWGITRSLGPGVPMAFLVFPGVVLAASRFGALGATLSSMLASAVSVTTVLDWPDLAQPQSAAALYGWPIVQASFAATLALTALTTSAAMAERQWAHRERMRSDRQLRTVVEALPDVVLVLRKDGLVLDVISGSDRLLAAPREVLLGSMLSDVVPAEQALLAENVIHEVLRSQKPVTVEYSLNILGDEKWFSGQVVPFGGGELSRVLWVARDITALMQAHRRMASDERLMRKLMRLQEDERKLLSYKIHDGLVQFMVGAHMAVESVRDDFELDTEEVRRQMVWCQDLISRSIQEARHMISDLRPMIIDEQGIAQAVRYLLEEHGGEQINIRFAHNLDDTRLPELLEGTVFRIVKEALQNIHQHSQATEASVVLAAVGDILTITIEDNGVGFDKRTIPENRFGVEGIVKRAQLFGGTAEIESSPGEGTRIVVRLPIAPATEEDRDAADLSAWRRA